MAGEQLGRAGAEERIPGRDRFWDEWVRVGSWQRVWLGGSWGRWSAPSQGWGQQGHRVRGRGGSAGDGWLWVTVSPFRASERPDRVCPELHGPAHSTGGPARSAAAPGESGVPAHPTEVSSAGLPGCPLAAWGSVADPSVAAALRLAVLSFWRSH